MKLTRLTQYPWSQALGALSVLATLGGVAAQAYTQVPTLLSQVSQVTAEKILAFGLTPDPTPFIPLGLTQSRNPSEGRATIGLRDDRTPMTSRSYPWSAIGRLQTPVDDTRISICTGSLVAPDVVLTNAHCVIDADTHQLKSDITFKPNLINGRVKDRADIATVIDVIPGTDFQDDDTVPHPNDWAFVKLDRPLGETYGTLAWTVLPLAELLTTYRSELIMAGYSGDFPETAPGRTAGVHDGCSVLGAGLGTLLHTCDTFGGSSGGPIMAIIDGEFRIVALNSAELTESQVNTNTGETVQQQGLINYGVSIDPIVNFLQQADLN